MATSTGSAKSPRANPLSPYVLAGIEDLNEVIGHGSYAVVKKLKFRGLECVGKKMHDILYLNATPQQREDMLTRFQGECELLSRLHHPCIVQFMGVYFEEGTPLPILVMERLHSTLAATIDRYGVLPDQISYDILCDVNLGLRYLHEHSPPIVHRDLSANNVLLTPHMSGKISDLGVAKMLNLSPAQMTQLVQTKAPGTPCYMPPEALSSRPKYDTKIDIYSMGVMLIHVFCGEWPFPTDVFVQDPRNPNNMVAVTEVERRAEFLRKIGNHPLTSLMHRCLSNNSALRPDAAQFYTQLSMAKGHLPVVAETRIELVRQLQSSQDETVAVRRAFEEQERKMKALTREKEREIETQTGEIKALRIHMQDVSLGSSAQSAVSTLEKEDEVQLLHPQSKLKWKRCANIPVRKSRMQAVAIGDEVYVGGGASINRADLDAVVKYNHTKDEWTRLPDHRVKCFSLCQFQGELLSVGGLPNDPAKVYRYSTADRKWVESLKPMPTLRAYPTLLTTASAIIACAGYQPGGVVLSSVEVYSSTTSQWHTADPLPQPRLLLSSVTICGCGFLLGGADASQESINSAYCVEMARLIDRATSPTRRYDTTSAWKMLPNTPLLDSTAATMSGGLLAVGGWNTVSGARQSTVHVLIPTIFSWVKLPSGDLPAENCSATAVRLPNNRVMVMGGRDKEDKDTNTCYIGSLYI